MPAGLESDISNRHATENAPRHLHQIRLHVHNLMFLVPFARKEVLQAIRLEPDRAVDETVLVGAGVVPE